jgi:hypothetical protein
MMTLLFFDANAIRNHGTLNPFEIGSPRLSRHRLRFSVIPLRWRHHVVRGGPLELEGFSGLDIEENFEIGVFFYFLQLIGISVCQYAEILDFYAVLVEDFPTPGRGY